MGPDEMRAALSVRTMHCGRFLVVERREREKGEKVRRYCVTIV